jgi:electron transport complex protein RnfB
VTLDPELKPMDPLAVALIDEARCIGCALCLPACPVDAISGAAGHMHTVIARHCTGCELCIPACPVDCIAMAAGERNAIGMLAEPDTDTKRAADARRRFEAHRRRTAAQALAAEARRQQRQARVAARRSWDDA